MRGEQSRLQIASHGQEEEEEEEEKEEVEAAGRTTRNRKPERHADVSEASLTPAVKVSVLMKHQPDKLVCSSQQSQGSLCSDDRPLPPVDCSVTYGTSSHREPSSLPHTDLILSPNPQSSRRDTFNSSFSFIQQSLNMSQSSETTTASSSQETQTLNQSTKALHSPQTRPRALPVEDDVSEKSTPVQSLPSSTPGSHADREEPTLNGRFWQECLWGDRKGVTDLPNLDSLDIEITSSLDSDNASASSVTSGYESATPASDQGWDSLVKKYEGVLQDCLQNNRTHAKVGTSDCLVSRIPDAEMLSQSGVKTETRARQDILFGYIFEHFREEAALPRDRFVY